MVQIIDGAKLAKIITNKTKVEVDAIKAAGGEVNFAAVMVGNNPASEIYIKRKMQSCTEVGINMTVHRPKGEQKALNALLRKLSADKKVHGILLQLPLPSGLSAREAISNIAPSKDVDGLTAENFGRLAVGECGLIPCTARGILHALQSGGAEVAGKDVCIIGRSDIVGKPTALLLTRHDATVTLCHSKTRNLALHTKKADIVIAAAGHAGLVRANMIRPGAVIVDVGINRLSNGKVCGDVDFDAVAKKAGAITPVPGGIGPLTIAFLLCNILQAYGEVKKCTTDS